ncbi:hypothetical protein HZC30_07345 [Candidatus Woesearchaeota archaeon]|nr:hypothetical protein [Candidatus Woesearchaeota archaeon]
MATEYFHQIKEYFSRFDDKINFFEKNVGQIILKAFQKKIIDKEEKEKLDSAHNISKEEKMKILTRVVMAIPFDYSALRKRMAENISNQKGLSFKETKQFYLHEPVQTLDSFIQSGKGGTCSAGSQIAAMFYQYFGFDSKLLTLARINGTGEFFGSEGSDQVHICTLLKVNNQSYYVDSSLNIETPILIPKEGVYDSKEESDIFNIILNNHRGIISVTCNLPGEFSKNLWTFRPSNDESLDVIIKQMQFTTNPFRDTHYFQQLKYTALASNKVVSEVLKKNMIPGFSRIKLCYEPMINRYVLTVYSKTTLILKKIYPLSHNFENNNRIDLSQTTELKEDLLALGGTKYDDEVFKSLNLINNYVAQNSN